MILPETENLIIKLLLTISNKEKEIEIIREILCQSINFNPFQLFSFIDKERKNYIDSYNLIDILNKNSININKFEIDYLIFLYDIDCDNYLSFPEFLNMILSEKKKFIGKNNNNKNDLNNYKYIPYEIENCFITLLIKEIDFIINVNKIINNIKEREDCNIQNIFCLLSEYQFITKESIINFFKKNYTNFNNNDIRYIIKKIDLNKDNKIDFNEFQKFFCFKEQKKLMESNYNINMNNNNYVINNNYYNNNNNNNISINPKDNSFYISKNLSLRNNPERFFSKFTNNINDNQPNQFKNEFNNLGNTNGKIECNCYICRKFPCICSQINYEKGEKEFINYIIECINVEKQIEKEKINLSSKYDFNIENIFQIFDINNQNFVSNDDLINGFKLFNIYLSENDIKLIKRRLNKKKLDNFFYSDFFDLFIPYDKKRRNLMEKKKPSTFIPEYNKTDVFLISTKRLINNLINLIISSENYIQNLRKKLFYSIKEIKNIFENIDKGGLGNINDVDLNNFLKIKGININDYDSSLLFIKLDKDKNGKVQCWELINELQNTL